MSQPAVLVRRGLRRSCSRLGRRWQRWSCRAYPDVSLSGLPHHVQCSTRHTLVPFENPLTPDCNGARCARRRSGRIARRAGLRYRQATITTWLSRAGEHAQSLHEHAFRNLWLPHLQLDELRTRLRSCKHVLWLWLAIDPLTKILPVLELGPRTQHTAHVLIHALQRSLAAFLPPALYQ